MYKFLTCLPCDFLKQGKGRVNEIEVSETSKCLSFQAFLSACLSHDLFSTLDASFICIAAGVKYYKKKKTKQATQKARWTNITPTSDVQSFRNGFNIVTLFYAGNSFFTFQMILHAIDEYISVFHF